MEVTWKKRLDDLQIGSLSALFGVEKPVIGMVHLWPLPGSPGYAGYGIDEILGHARRDAAVLLEGGADGLIVENMWDLPYYVGTDVEIEAVVAQGVAARKIKEMAGVPVGVNVIHNGWHAELSIAIAAGLDFMRVCILTGARLWDTGDFDGGCAADLLRRRKALGAEHIKLFADVDKKHSVPFPGIDLETHIEWTEFYRPDALIVSGRMTGDAPDVEKVRGAKEAARRPILMGSGTTAENIGAFLRYADGAIVGTSLKVDGVMENPVDPARVRRYVEAVQAVRHTS
ncbi:MAG: BtpA/SgcQ family protein [Anaerolineae bacterium]